MLRLARGTTVAGAAGRAAIGQQAGCPQASRLSTAVGDPTCQRPGRIDDDVVHPDLRSHLHAHRVVCTSAAGRWCTPDELRGAVQRGELRRVWRGVLALPEQAGDLRTRLDGLELLSGGSVVACLGSAAELLGFAVQTDPAVHVLATPGHHLGSRAGLKIHQRTGAPIGRLDGQRLTMPAWTALEVARTVSRPRALATLDAALHAGRCTPEGLELALGQQHARRGTAVLGELVSLADGRSESPMESETRLVLHDGDLPAPVLQHPVLDEWGRELYRLDLAWPAARVAVEYDGFDHHSSPADLRRDRSRAAWLLDHGWTVLRVTATDVRREPALLVSRVHRLLARATTTPPGAR